jgi:phospholipid N-methyltransferase
MADDGKASDKAGPGKVGEVLVFMANFVKNPARVGWLLPSSRFVVNDVLKQIDWHRARVIVEYGPGTGTFTTRMLKRMRPDAQLIAVEINPEFCRFLSEIDSILSRFGATEVDYVISGIPFATLPHHLRHSIVRKTHSVLRRNGKFLVYQVSSAVLPYLESVFGDVSRRFQPLNFVPTQLFCCARA